MLVFLNEDIQFELENITKTQREDGHLRIHHRDEYSVQVSLDDPEHAQKFLSKAVAIMKDPVRYSESSYESEVRNFLMGKKTLRELTQ